MSEQASQRALSDVVVLDLSRDLAGPLATQMLGDMGALVLKAEEPSTGHETRSWGPPFVEAYSAYFLAFNRNKRAFTVNLKHPQGKKIGLDLLQQADVLVENFRGETAERLGLAPSEIEHINPRVIHLSVSGFGRSSSMSERPGYDLVMQGLSGLMSITGETDGPPTRFGIPIIDILTGLHGAYAVLAALHHRDRTGQGQWIDLALYDVALSTLANVGSAYLNIGKEPKRFGNAHPSLVPYQPFRTLDGTIIVSVGNDEQWRRLCHAVNLPTLVEDERFTTNAGRVMHRNQLLPTLEEVFEEKSTTQWMDILSQARVPAGPVRLVSEAISDPIAAERHLIWEGTDAVQQSLRGIASPLAHLSRTPAQLYTTPPTHGKDTEWVLSVLLGFDSTHIALLQEEDVI